MNEEKPKKKKVITISVADGGLLRKKYRIGDEVGPLNPDDIPELEEADDEGKDDEVCWLCDDGKMISSRVDGVGSDLQGFSGRSQAFKARL